MKKLTRYTPGLLIRSQPGDLGGAYLYRVGRPCYLLFTLHELDLNIVVSILKNIRCSFIHKVIFMVVIGVVLYENSYPVNFP